MKYTLKQINKALSLFDQIENATLVCRQLGYPSVSVLYLWIRKRRRNNGVFLNDVLKVQNLSEMLQMS